MLAIRMQRTGRKGYPMYRVIVQEGHRQPTSGKVVANLGSYNPHTKESTLDAEKAATFLKNGAQPSDRVVKLLQAEKVTLPAWVKVTSAKKQKSIKNTEKLRRNQPAPEPAEEPQAELETPEEPAEAVTAEATAAEEAPVETDKVETEEAPAEPAEAKDESKAKPEPKEKA